MDVKLCSCGCGAELTGRQRSWASVGCRKTGSRNAQLMKLYGITIADYDKILKFQGGVCAVTGRKPKPGETFHVDHEHRDGQAGPVRGILSAYANTRLVGRLKDHATAQRMADYLRDPPATQALGREVIATGSPKKRRKRRDPKRR